MSEETVVGHLEGARGQFNIEWKVENFLSLSAEVSRRYCSPMFFFCNSSWYLRLHPNGQKCHSSEGYIGVYVMRGDSGPPVPVTYSLFLKKTDGRRVILKEKMYLFQGKDDGRGKAKAIGRSELIDQKSVFFPSGVLTLICCLKCDDIQVDKVTPNLDEKPATTYATTYVSGGSTFKFSFADTKCLSNLTTEVTGSELIKQTPSFTFETPSSANTSLFGVTPNLDEKPATTYATTYVSGGSTFKFSFADTKCLSNLTTEVTGSELIKQTPSFTFETPSSANTSLFGAFGATKGATSNVCGESTSGVFSLNTRSFSKPAAKFKFSQPSHVQLCSQKSPIQAFGSGLFGQTSFGTCASTSSYTFGGTEKLSVDMNELLLNGDLSDFTIEVKGVEFRLHRNILSARSPVFQSMLKHNMKEKETGRVSVDDCEVDTFRAFVRYLYTGRTDQLNADIVFGLFALADKYQVHELKSACVAFIKSNLLVETFCDTVQFALRYDNRELLKQAIDFLAVKTSEVLKTVKWMNFMTTNPIQANELLLKALDRKQQ